MLSRALASKSGSAAMMARTMVPRLARPTALRTLPATSVARNTPRQMFIRLQHASKPAGATHQVFKPLDTFPRRHIGPDDADKAAMLKSIGLKDIDELLSKTIPPAIRSPKTLALSEGVPERELLKRLKSIASKNKVYRSYIGMGYTDTVVPNVILRNVLENPAWYTQVKKGFGNDSCCFGTWVSDMCHVNYVVYSLSA